MTKPLEFIKGIFGDDIQGKKAQPLFCGFPDDPGTQKSWTVKIIQNKKLPQVIKKENNNYFTPAVFRKSPEGNYRAQKKYFVAGYAIYIDDIGTKVKNSEIKKLPLSWKVMTSPGNYQGGYILDTPCTDRRLYEAIIDAMAGKKLTDSGAKGSARWIRMPFGKNTKKEHIVDGVAPKVKLANYHPERRYSINQIIAAFDLKIDCISRDRVVSSNDDRVLAALKDANLWKGVLEAGKHDITCPWVKQHTKSVDHGTVYFEPCADNKQKGGFNCQHGHCSTRNIADLKEFLGILDNKHKTKPLVAALELVHDIPAYRDENGDPFVYLDGNCLPLKSREVKAYIIRRVYLSTGKALSQKLLSEALSSLEGRAICEGKQIKLHLRIAHHKGRFLYDLGDGNVVKTGCKGWKIEIAPPLFKRYGHQQVQVEPASGGDPWTIFEYLNIAEEHKLETLVLLISYLVPDISHPIFHPHGAQGSGKTTLCKMVKALLDPSSLDVIIAPKNKMELVRQINRHHVPLFDNMSRLDSEMSDILCVACTGGGVTKRTLFTDDEDSIYNFKRCIGLNGINLLITKPDLLDRSMLLHLERIPEEMRRLEEVLWPDFSKAKPKILGGMFDVLSKAKRIYPEVNLTKKPRLADFATWGYAIAEALEKGKGKQFISAYQANIKRQSAEVLQNNSLCLAVTQLMRSENRWEGTMKKAHEKLYDLALPSKNDGTFPADAKNLRKHLERIQTTLAEAEHITYSFSEKPKKDGYHIEFLKQK